MTKVIGEYWEVYYRDRNSANQMMRSLGTYDIDIPKKELSKMLYIRHPNISIWDINRKTFKVHTMDDIKKGIENMAIQKEKQAIKLREALE